MLRNAAAAAARVVLILALAGVIRGGWEDSAHHDRSVDVDLAELVAKSHEHEHEHDHHQHEAGHPSDCEKQGGNCVREHGERGGVEGLQHQLDHGKDGEPHMHCHGDCEHADEPELRSDSHSHEHSEDSRDHGDESQADSHPHSHSRDHGAHAESQAHHNCPHEDHHHHHHHQHHQHQHNENREHLTAGKILLEKLGQGHSHAEEEIGFQSHLRHHHHEDGTVALKQNLTTVVWLWAMGCSLLVSLASLVCLVLLPVIMVGGKPSRKVVDALAGFGAGCMLGDALLHQLPHAFSGGGHSHSNSDHGSHDHHSHEHEGTGEHGHGHSLQDLSVGLAVLSGILLFFLVEKIVRRTEELAVHGHSFGHSHHHHRVKKDDEEITQVEKLANKDETSVMRDSDSKSGLRKRNTRVIEESTKADPSDIVKREEDLFEDKEDQGHASNFVLSYLNLFSDGVHNFTDGMALGSAFLLHGTVGGWSTTLFLLAHELPQEVGDFGILLRSGFSVSEALFFNFLSALMALAGTAFALLVGGNPGHSSLIEGFTAGGFIYIAVGAVMPDMHSQGNSLRTTFSQLAALSLGMGAAILISLAE